MNKYEKQLQLEGILPTKLTDTIKPFTNKVRFIPKNYSYQPELFNEEKIIRHKIPSTIIMDFIFNQKARLESIYAIEENTDKLNTCTSSTFHC